MKIFFMAALLVSGLRAQPAKPAASRTGAQIYLLECSGCHAKDGKGNRYMAEHMKADLSRLNLTKLTTQKKTDVELAKILSKGGAQMPPYNGHLNDVEIALVLAYVRAFSSVAPVTASH